MVRPGFGHNARFDIEGAFDDSCATTPDRPFAPDTDPSRLLTIRSSARAPWRAITRLGVATAVVVATAAWLNSYRCTELDMEVVWGASDIYGDVCETVARYVPTDFNGAVEALRDLGFEEGNRWVGATYRRWPVPELNEINSTERGKIKRYNALLDKYDATSVKLFSREVPHPILLGDRIYVRLLMKEDGTMKIEASHAYALIGMFP